MKRLAFMALACVMLAACGRSKPPANPEWVIHSHIEFDNSDPPPPQDIRMGASFWSGDMYARPFAGSFTATVNPDYTFELDLNRGHSQVLESLKETEFRYPEMHIEPQDARIVRISPSLTQANGVELTGATNWVDPETDYRLVLVYFDRPARITGDYWDINVTEPGYVWVEQPPRPAQGHVVPQPEGLVLLFHRTRY